MQVYRGMDIGTAKPTAADRRAVPHHAIDLVDADTAFSIADWTDHAIAAVRDVRARGRIPFVVGGTGFYLQALVRGVPTVPAADPDVQASLWERLEREGLEPLVAELEAASPPDAARAQRNPRRVIRALEVLERTGRPPSSFGFRRPPFEVRFAVLLPSMDALEPRIAARTAAMFDAGLVDEVRRLASRHDALPTALQAIGTKEVAEHLRGEIDLDAAKAAVELATRQYAKRQRTWFRKEARHGVDRVFRALAPDVVDELAAWLDGVAAERDATEHA